MIVARMKNGYCFMGQRYKIAVSPDFKMVSNLKFNKITITACRKNAWQCVLLIAQKCLKPMRKSLKKLKKVLKMILLGKQLIIKLLK